MAKIKGGLFSLGSSGKLAKTLVYSKWKAVDYVRELVTPANPRTTAQVAQRMKMAVAIRYWQLPSVANYVRLAWNKLASREIRPLSGCNLATRNWLNLNAAIVAGNIATTGVVVYAGDAPDKLVQVTTSAITGDLGLAVAVTRGTGDNAFIITGAIADGDTIVDNKTLNFTASIGSAAYLRVAAITTDGSTTIDLTGIVSAASIA